ncbi:hypothetical protein VaNZ11_012363 [Volvox africanus]|uniref:[Phosphatase 2A protein]-leucine-carboxy methyltransferase 1 n=1 Tax=Volvox africanus TaxID=51714 RepID=A0ABQ5SDQ0_9CHLO|nr:hypothetical protein VaNZ11_012363 [Volvox africanus]
MPKARTLPALLALIIVAEEGLRLVLRHILKRRRKKIDHKVIQESGIYGGLESLVSFSACLIAANRAVETEEPEPYILDPLAAGLCGQEALDARRARDRVAAPAVRPVANTSTLLQPEPMAGLHPCQRPIPRLIMRTKFFDDVVTAVTWRGSGVGEKAGDHSCHKELLATLRRAERPCRQVVLLGSGLDARPWRLPLPLGVRWFEVDRTDVLAAKQARLQVLGAQIDAGVAIPPTAVSGHNGAGSAQFILPQKQQQQQQQQQAQATQAGVDDAVRTASGAPVKWRYPLHAAEWSCCAVDLQRSGWSRGLLDQGLDSSSPVLWVLEGLLYYLDEPDVRALLQEAASISAPESIIAASVIRAVRSADSSGGATLLPPQGGSSRSSGGKGPSGEGQATYRLNNEFKWKCREDIPKFFRDCGWGAMACLSWLDAAKSYGLPTAVTTTSSVFLITAALA